MTWNRIAQHPHGPAFRAGDGEPDTGPVPALSGGHGTFMAGLIAGLDTALGAPYSQALGSHPSDGNRSSGSWNQP